MGFLKKLIKIDADTLNGQTSAGGGADEDSILEKVYPVGSIYISVNNVNPGTLFGIGTWVAWGSGKVPVGVDADTSYFNSVEKTGGSTTVTLTYDQCGVAPHSHTFTGTAHTHTFTGKSVNTSTNGSHTHTELKVDGNVKVGFSRPASFTSSPDAGFLLLSGLSSTVPCGLVTDAQGSHYHTVTASGTNASVAAGGTISNNTAKNATTSHTNLQPYITCYMWKRTA